MEPRLPKTHQATTHRGNWALLAFRIPREPSSPRIAVWRKLKRLGVAQLVDGLVTLPLDNRNREQLEWIADEITEAGGESSVWIAKLASASQERELAARMAAAVAADYRALIDEANAACLQATGKRRRSLARLRRELRRIRSRDYFPPEERDLAVQAVEELAQTVEEVVR